MSLCWFFLGGSTILVELEFGEAEKKPRSKVRTKSKLNRHDTRKVTKNTIKKYSKTNEQGSLLMRVGKGMLHTKFTVYGN